MLKRVLNIFGKSHQNTTGTCTSGSNAGWYATPPVGSNFVKRSAIDVAAVDFLATAFVFFTAGFLLTTGFLVATTALGCLRTNLLTTGFFGTDF